MSDTDTGGLPGVPSDAAPRIRDCFECAQPVPAERERSVFCSQRCSNRYRKRRHREYVTIEVEVEDAVLELRVERGSIWGVECDREVADALREEARPPKRRRRRIPLPKRDIHDATLGT